MITLRHKFNAKRCEADDYKFASKKERARYYQLKLLKDTDEILFFLMQVPFHLPGKVKYIADFMVFWTDGTVTIEDVKGMKTPLYIAKKKIVEAEYNIKIIEI